MSTTTTHTGENEVTILACVLGNERGQLSPRCRPATSWTSASATATRPGCTTWPCGIRKDALSAAEKEELFAFAKAGTLLSILKSKARRTLGIKLETPNRFLTPLMDAALSQLVWQRAKGRCEYCQMPQAADDDPFEIDHMFVSRGDWQNDVRPIHLGRYRAVRSRPTSSWVR